MSSSSSRALLSRSLPRLFASSRALLSRSLPRRFAVRSFQQHSPKIADSAFIAPSAEVIGRVTIAPRASVWYNTTIRADVNEIHIGARTNIQDGTVIHCRSSTIGGKASPTIIGDDVTVGHCALLHACSIGKGAFIGMQACVMDFAVVEEGAMVAAGALVTPNSVVKTGELWAGRPAKCLRKLKDEELEMFTRSAESYADFGAEHKAQGYT